MSEHWAAPDGGGDSSLAAIANAVVAVPVHSSKQFGGSLFEQASLIVLDARIVDLTQVTQALTKS